ncbi:TIGR03364 family FAD-dependent oxidoreductase [Fodinicola feengrottensis]
MRILIVGGGVLGTMHAWHAVRRGHQVVQLERDAGPRAATVRNFGLVWVSGRAPGAETTVALRARELWEEIGKAARGLKFRAAGSLTIVNTDAEVAVLEQVMALPDAADRELKLLDAGEARALEPALGADLRAALWCGRDAIVEPRLVPGALRQALAASGRYQFLPGRTVVDADTGIVRDHLGDTHHGDAVVICPGAEHSILGGKALSGLHRCRLQMMQTAPLDIPLRTALADGDSLRYYPVFDVPARKNLPAPSPATDRWRMQLLCVQRADGGLTIGDTHAYDEPFDVGVAEEAYDELRGRAERILGRTIPKTVTRWAGVYSQQPEPVAAVESRHVLTAGVHLITGLGGRGMTASPAVAETTAKELNW